VNESQDLDQGWPRPPTDTALEVARAGSGWALIGHGHWLYVPGDVALAALDNEQRIRLREVLPISDPTFQSVVGLFGGRQLSGWSLFHERTHARAPLHPLTMHEIAYLYHPETGKYSKGRTRDRKKGWSGKYKTVPNKKNSPAAPASAYGAQSL
jgi:hypothetical protein